MAEELVVTDHLTDAMAEVGAELVRQLDESRWPVSAALWFYFPDLDDWRLILASPRVVEEGPRDAYKNVLEALDKLPDDIPRVGLNNILVTEPSHPLIKLLSFAVGTGPGTGTYRVRENVINGTFVEDALVYRLNPNPKAA